MKQYKRVFLIVLDSFGIGNAPDAEAFGDAGANTLKSVSASSNFKIKNLRKLGLANIDGADFLEKEKNPAAVYGRLIELSAGKDTTTGHFEISGIISREPLPVYPNGFPDEIISKFEEATGRKVLCNKTYSGTKVLEDYGEEHIKTGSLIVYTSADSVFQVAAHTDVVPLEKLYEYCKIARKILTGKNAVGRVIARPFAGEYPFTRTADRHDFSIEPPESTMLDKLKQNDFDVIAVGKIADIFAHRGTTEEIRTFSNSDGMEKTFDLLNKDFRGLAFTNLVDFDMVYGHRRDADGYADAISKFDDWLGRFTAKMTDEDLLIITADHGCDPAYKGTDHTRECVPLIIYANDIKPVALGTIEGFDNIGKFILRNFSLE